MTKAKKYYLVDPVKYEKLVQSQVLSDSKPEVNNTFTHPNVKAVGELDNEMKKILSDEKLTDFEKVEQYNSKLESYLQNFRSAIETPKREALIGKTSPDNENKNTVINQPDHPLPTHDLIESELALIPESYRKNGKRLLNFLKSSKSFSWDEAGQVKYRDKAIHGSNISKLLNDAVRNRKITSQRSTYDEFLKALDTEGYPINKRSSSIPVRRSRLKTSKHNKLKRQYSRTNIPKDISAEILKNWHAIK